MNWLERTEAGAKRTKNNWFGKIASLFEKRSFGDELWDELEELLILSDVGIETTAKLVETIKQRVKDEKILEPSQVREVLKDEMVSLLKATSYFSYSGKEGEFPQVILVVGVNGTGKTTSVAKLAWQADAQGKNVILAAADTFRAAAIDQLKYWGKEIGVDVVAHQQGADPAAVVFDAVQAAIKRKAQVVLIDTAGRLHTKVNLMDELKKIKRVIVKHDTSNSPQILLVMDATTGQNGLLQAKSFCEAIDVDGVILTKLDGTAKGGIVFTICDDLHVPVAYIGTGERLQDIASFDAEEFVNAIFS